MSGLPKPDGLVAWPTVLAIETLLSPPTFIDIANLGDITGSASYTVQDVSSHGNRARAKITTLLDSGEWSTTLWFIPGAGLEPTHTSAANGLQAIFERGDLRQFALFYRDDDGTALFFQAYVSKFALKAPVAGVVSADVTFTVTGTMGTGTEAGGPPGEFAPAES
jgi:hypothetical protein